MRAFATVHITRNISAGLHVDSNNEGRTTLMTFGDFQGGELWIMKKKTKKRGRAKKVGRGQDETTIIVNKLFRGARSYGIKVGDEIKGYIKDAQDKPITFDGNMPHMTMLFTGNRYAMMCYTGKGAEDAPEDALEEVKSIGVFMRDQRNQRARKQTKADRECINDANSFICKWDSRMKGDSKEHERAEEFQNWGSTLVDMIEEAEGEPMQEDLTEKRAEGATLEEYMPDELLDQFAEEQDAELREERKGKEENGVSEKRKGRASAGQ